MFEPKISITKKMMERIKEAVEIAGYSSVDEFVTTALERELERTFSSRPEKANEEESIKKSLQGLGYID